LAILINKNGLNPPPPLEEDDDDDDEGIEIKMKKWKQKVLIFWI
jgi:hypothetical protein